MRFLRTILLLASGGVLARLQRLWSSERPATPVSTERARPSKRLTAIRLFKVAAALFLLAIGGFLVAASGLIPIKASSGHWAITAWFLNFSMERSVSTHAMGIDIPPLDDPALIMRGAGHYETGCKPCHGSPELPYPRIALQMTPHPPELAPAIPNWKSNQLFYIVKHGVKFTGMPGWPTQERDDEVWAMVAFLRTLPDMSAPEYRRLVYGNEGMVGERTPLRGLLGPAAIPQAVTASCARCHGVDGLGRGVGAFPRLAGQKPDYLYAALLAYSRSQRHSGIMEPIAAALTEADIGELARYYGSLRPAPGQQPSTGAAGAIERGRLIASRGIPKQRVPSCRECHGPAPTRKNPFYPTLTGQYESYLVQQLKLLRAQQRGGSPYVQLMHKVATRLTDEQIQDVARFYSSLDTALVVQSP